MNNTYYLDLALKNMLLVLFLSFVSSVVVFGQDTIPVYTMADTIIARQYLERSEKLLEEAKYNESLEFNEKALSIYSSILGDSNSIIVEVLNVKCELAFRTQKLEDAENYGKQALGLGLSILNENHPYLSRSYHNLGIVYLYQHSYEESLDFFQKALEFEHRKRKKDFEAIASINNNIGIVCYFQARYKEALQYYEEALEIREEHLPPNHPSIAATCNNIGGIYYYQGDYISALNYFEKALKLNVDALGSNHPNIADNYNNLGMVYYYSAGYERALLYLQKAREIYQNSFEENHPSIALTLNNIADANEKLKNWDQAILYYQKALDKQLLSLGELHPDVAATYIRIGSMYLNKRQYEIAIENLQVAFGIYNSLDSPPLNALPTVYLKLGQAYNELGVYAEALKLYELALSLNVGSENFSAPVLSEVYYRIGKVHNELASFDSARINLFEALAILNFEFPKPSSFKHTPSLPGVKMVLKEVKYYYENKKISTGDLSYIDSLDLVYKSLISLEEYHQKNNTDPFARLFYAEESLPVYESAIAYISTGKSLEALSKAFLLAEQTKSRQLAEQIQLITHESSFGIPDSLKKREYLLNLNISTVEKNIFTMDAKLPSRDSLISVYENELISLQQAKDEFLDVLKRDYTDYFELRYDISALDIEQIQKHVLSKKQSLVEYFVGDSTIYLFLVQSNNYEVVQIKKDFPLDSLVEDLREGLYKYHITPEKEQTNKLYDASNEKYISAATALYHHLLAPVAEKLTQSLIIVPDGVLGYIPFETLLTNSDIPNVDNYATYPYLLKDHFVSYAYSATLLHGMQTRKHRVAPTKSLLAMAPFHKDGYTQGRSIINRQVFLDTISSSSSMTVKYEFTPLPNSGIEAQEVSKLWGGRYISKRDATELLFNESAGDYRIIHLATHGQVDDHSSDYSFLAFAQIPDSIENELLYVRDIYNLQLNADLVVLSACNAGVGKLKRGEGIISLARAFAYAGAKSIVTTLWVADDTSTKDLMIDFHTQLKAGLSKDEALRQAKLDYIENHSNLRRHPFFWSSFIAIGDMAALK